MFEKSLSRPVVILSALTFLTIASAHADVFNMGGTRNANGTWNGLASLEMVTIGNPGNGPDRRDNLDQRPEGYGAVDYVYRIGKYEVTNAQWREFLVAKAAVGDPYGLYDTRMAEAVETIGGIARSGSGTVGDPWVYYAASNDSNWDNRPVNWVSFWDAARFCNWLHNGQGDGDTESGAYINIGSQSTFARQAGARYWIPNEDEWYKAAYHRNNGVTSNYWDYPTRTYRVPSNDLAIPDPGNNANFYDNGLAIGSPYYTTVVGQFENSDSPYGTFDQGGNMAEWNETVVMSSWRGVRGGRWSTPLVPLRASFRSAGSPMSEYHGVGFRVAGAIPEPGGLALLAAMAAMGLLSRGGRRD